MNMTSIKKRVGWLFGKPIVDGDPNLVTRDEIYLKDPKTLSLSVRDSNGELVTPSEGNDSKNENDDTDANSFSITSSDTLLYWASGSGDRSVYDAVLIDITKKTYSYVTSLDSTNPVYSHGNLPILKEKFPWASKTTTNVISPNIFDITGIQLINAMTHMWGDFSYRVFVTPDGTKVPLEMSNEIDPKTINAGLQLLLKPNPMSNRNCTGTVSFSGLVLMFSDLYLEILANDATVVVDTIQIHKYKDPGISTHDLRSSNKSYRVRYVEALIEEEEAKNEPDENYLAELIAAKELFEEWDAAAKEKAE